MTQDPPRARGARALALWTLALGFVGAMLTGLSAASWLQGYLRYGCSWAAGGTERPTLADGAWVCSDGIALLMPGAAIMLLGGLALLIMALLVLAVWDRVPARAGSLAAAALLAAAPIVVTCLALLVDASAQDASAQGALAQGAESRMALWNAFALPSLIATIGAALLSAAGIWLRARGRARKSAGALVIVALALLLASAALSMLGTLSLGIVAACIIVAMWSLASSVKIETIPARAASGASTAPSAATPREKPGEGISAAMSIEGVPDRRLE